TFNDMSKSWSDDVAARLGAAVRKQRGKRSGQWLADRTAEVGMPIPRTTISELETGRRKVVNVAELLVLAKALEIPPALLLFPGMPDGDVEVLPDVIVSSEQAARWVVGEQRIDGATTTETGAIRIRSASAGEQLMEEVARRREEAPDLKVLAQGLHEGLRSEEGANSEQAVRFGTMFREAREKRAAANARIRDLGGTVSDA
ncbi:MAG: hypothetical protein WBD41_25825, partial [Rhodococcus sp. (in: high G+C Gram-positive bacteria)]